MPTRRRMKTWQLRYDNGNIEHIEAHDIEELDNRLRFTVYDDDGLVEEMYTYPIYHVVVWFRVPE